jgi:methylphosphotriester-DNA--protein-cysteine methyltransferase
MRFVDTYRNGVEGVKGEWWKGLNSTMVYCKAFCKCHSVPPVQQ